MQLNGRQTPLPVTDPKDEVAAFAAFQRLLAASTTSTTRPEPIADLTAEYLDAIGHRISLTTRRGYEILLRRLSARLGNRAAGEIEPCIVEKVAANENWSDSHRANFLFAAQAFLRWCGRKDLKLARPAKESRGAEAVISPELHARILRECTGDFHQFVKVLWLTGARPMEVAGLTVEGIDQASGTATLKKHKTKHKGKKRILYLSSESLEIVAEQTERYRSGHLFRGYGGRPFSRMAIVCRFLRVSAKIGKDVTAYQYRHSWASRALAAGIPDTHVAALMGHTSTNMLHRHYSHITANARLLREVAERAAG